MKSIRSTLIPLALASGILAIGADCISFRRGDANDDGRIDMSDAIFTLNYLFLGGEAPPCLDAADSNDDGIVDISDPIYILNFLFLGSPESPASGGECGFDPSPDLLTCGSFGSCSPCKVPASENAAPFVTIYVLPSTLTLASLLSNTATKLSRLATRANNSGESASATGVPPVLPPELPPLPPPQPTRIK